jgi:hypothetical protein
MFSWAKQRQLMYGSAVFIFLGLVIGTPTYLLFFNKAPTCFDRKQNGNETGVDCGGQCITACARDVVAQPVIIWARPFVVTNGLTNLVAYIQNPNVDYIATPAEYLFRVYDKDNVLLGTRVGRAAVPPSKVFPVFEQAFDSGFRKPVKAYFEFTEPLVWKKFSNTKPELDVIDKRLSSASSSPRLDATLVNKTIDTYRNIEVVAIIYDTDGNALAASRTVVDVLYGNSESPLVFTWPHGFKVNTSKIEIIPKLPL